MIDAELPVPVGEFRAQSFENRGSALELDPVALAVIEADRLDRGKTAQRPGEAGCRILAPRE